MKILFTLRHLSFQINLDQFQIQLTISSTYISQFCLFTSALMKLLQNTIRIPLKMQNSLKYQIHLLKAKQINQRTANFKIQFFRSIQYPIIGRFNSIKSLCQDSVSNNNAGASSPHYSNRLPSSIAPSNLTQCCT